MEKTVDRENLVYRTDEYTYSVKTYRTRNTFGWDIYNGKITLKETDEDQASLLVEIFFFLKKKTRLQNPEKKQEEKNILKNVYALFEARERVLDAIESKIFPIKIERTGFLDKVSDHSNLKILTPKRMLQRTLLLNSSCTSKSR